MDVKEISVNLEERSYPVVVGSGCIKDIDSYISSSVKKVAYEIRKAKRSKPKNKIIVTCLCHFNDLFALF